MHIFQIRNLVSKLFCPPLLYRSPLGDLDGGCLVHFNEPKGNWNDYHSIDATRLSLQAMPPQSSSPLRSGQGQVQIRLPDLPISLIDLCHKIPVNHRRYTPGDSKGLVGRYLCPNQHAISFGKGDLRYVNGKGLHQFRHGSVLSQLDLNCFALFLNSFFFSFAILILRCTESTLGVMLWDWKQYPARPSAPE